MASPTTFTRSIASVLKEGSTTLDTGGAPAVTADQKVDLVQPILGATANQHFTMSVLKDKLKQFYATCDVDCSVFTNNPSGSSPDNTIHLTALVAVRYEAGTNDTNPVTAANVTDLYVTVAGALPGTLRIFTLQDPVA